MKITFFIGFLLAMWELSPAWSADELSDDELDRITAGSVISTEMADGVLRFQFSGDKGTKSIEGTGTLSATPSQFSGGLEAIMLNDRAQSNLSSFIKDRKSTRLNSSH